jgi:glycosyltransferase involved in cell wall biosynthesis
VSKVSVIMPCLNSARYIREALDSVVKQSLRNIELLVVDAGSTDGTAEILNEYAGKDPRVRILQSDKKSMGRQYNLGMDAAKGEYIGFVESDDYIAPDMYESLYNAAAASRDVDYVKANYDMFVDFPEERIFLTYGPIAPKKFQLYNRILGAKELASLLPRDDYIWNGIYDKDFINTNGIRFNEISGAAFQDAGFLVQTLALADKALYIDKSLYRYRRDNPGSSFIDRNAYVFAMDEFFHIDRFMKETARNIELFEPRIFRKYFGMFNYNLRRFLYHGAYSPELSECTAPFREAFRKGYDGLGFVKRSRSDLWPPQNILLFFEDFELYCRYTQLLARSDVHVHREAVEHFGKQKEIIICGSGEAASSVYCYLRRLGLNNIASFCDDDTEAGIYMKLLLIGVHEIAESYPDALFLITNYSKADIIRNRLTDNGIPLDMICYYGEGLDPHRCFEIPVGIQ